MPFKTMSKILQPNMVFNTILNMASLLTMYLSNKLARPYFDLKIALNFEAHIKFYMDTERLNSIHIVTLSIFSLLQSKQWT